MLYSPSRKGFFSRDLHGDGVPPDALEITQEAYDALLAGQGDGATIAPGPDGRPVLVAAVAPTAEQLLAAEREAMIVSRFQARAALHIAGLLAQVEAAVAAADPLAQMAWADAQEFRRNSPTIAGLAATVGLSEEQLDDLFRQAAQISA